MSSGGPSSPTPAPADESHAAADPAATAEDGIPTPVVVEKTRAEEAERVLWPWVARRTRAHVVALVLISSLALGPLVALVVILRSDPSPVNTLIPAGSTDLNLARVTATALGLSPGSGELRTRISFTPSPELIGENGRLTEPILLTVNGSEGAATRTYAEGETTAPFEVGLPLAEGSTTRYPFDRYRGSLVVVVSVDSASRQEPIPVLFEFRSVIADFVLSADRDPKMGPEPAQAVSVLDWTARRPGTTTVYAVWLMVLMWGLAATGLLIVWAVVIWMVEIPFWAFGYFVGVLFALPPLRDSLPGRPPPGTIFDFISFYWSVTIIGVNLILMLAIWLIRTRAKERLQALDSDQPG